MDVYHGTWLPPSDGDFNNYGQFIIWIEIPTRHQRKSKTTQHPNHLGNIKRLKNFLATDLSLTKALIGKLQPEVISCYATLPSEDKRPLPSPEMANILGDYPSENFQWQNWSIHAISLREPLLFLREIQFIANFNSPDFRLGADLLFWIQYAQQLRNLIRQHQFIPVMKCRQPVRKTAKMRIYTGWSPAGSLYEQSLEKFAAALPPICTLLRDTKLFKTMKASQPKGFDGIALLRHFSEQELEALVLETPITQQMLTTLKDNWLTNALGYDDFGKPSTPNEITGLKDEDWKQWNRWQQEIIGQTKHIGFSLGIRLQPLNNRKNTEWQLNFYVESSQDPSLKIDLSEWWTLSAVKQKQWQKHLGQQFERNLLMNLGHAARMCPLLWQGMESTHPASLSIDLQSAYDFLKNDAAVLEAAGFKIIVPSWWTPKGRKRARIRIQTSGKSTPSEEKETGKGYFGLPSLVEYQYELSVGDEAVTQKEWQELVNAKSPLVQFRGEWMELDSQQMEQLLDLWQQQENNSEALSVNDLLKQVAEADENTEYVFDEVLTDILNRLQQQESIEAQDNPKGLKGELREYQKQGLAWLVTQEALGLNPCLADDMGLGKTIQIIALLLDEREKASKQDKLLPTLLIAPTSVLGNWQKEMQKFSPELNSLIHHGGKRAKKLEDLDTLMTDTDVLITSFSIARRDSKLLKQKNWQRIVVDEAQNIKNPKSAQAKAIYALKAPHRIAMTGTPIENRLMDMWSLFHFLNPGYLGTALQFKRGYETPIQRDNNKHRAQQLKRLVHPFILRRLKSDKSIIDDLPDKIEQKVYCNLTKEQASLYQAVVDDVQAQLEDAEGIQRKGLILSTLMKLKQICNHPTQFLQDESEFSPARSHKLARIDEMVQVALDDSDSLLIFTQFTEIGRKLEQLLREKHACPVHYLHGGSSRKHREQMIENFQNPESEAGVFILSLKAGGVGITLTRANHVFHFDRWWNPAVENQATDRAYRIGQEKKVFVHKMVTLGTLEERIDQMLEDKQNLADSIVGSGENWLTEMDNKAFGELIQLNRNTILEA